MKMLCTVKMLLSLLLVVHCSRAQISSDDSTHSSLVMSPRSLVSLMMLGVTVVLSGGIYLWVLRYVCIGCCQPIGVGSESEDMAGIV